jgi:hypothetical protein
MQRRPAGTATTTWGERLAAACALSALLGLLTGAMTSCGGEDLIFSGEIPSQTPQRTNTPTVTPGGDDDGFDDE